MYQFNFSERYLEIGSGKIALCQWGSADAPVLFGIHGLMDQAASWDMVAKEMVNHGYQVIIPDLRGHGNSFHSPEGMETSLMDYFVDIAEIIQKLDCDIEMIFGHSMGGLIAMMFAASQAEWKGKVTLIEPIVPGEIKNISAFLRNQFKFRLANWSHSPMATIENAAEKLTIGFRGVSKELAISLTRRHVIEQSSHYIWRWDARIANRSNLVFPGGNEVYLKLLEDYSERITWIRATESQFNRPDDLERLGRRLVAADKLSITGGHNVHLDNPVGVIVGMLGVHNIDITGLVS